MNTGVEACACFTHALAARPYWTEASQCVCSYVYKVARASGGGPHPDTSCSHTAAVLNTF
jgi:hypothetical protein